MAAIDRRRNLLHIYLFYANVITYIVLLCIGKGLIGSLTTPHYGYWRLPPTDEIMVTIDYTFLFQILNYSVCAIVHVTAIVFRRCCFSYFCAVFTLPAINSDVFLVLISANTANSWHVSNLLTYTIRTINSSLLTTTKTFDRLGYLWVQKRKQAF